MSSDLRNDYALLTDYTQGQEDTLATTLTGKTYGWVKLRNTTLNCVRVWNGTVFITPEDELEVLFFVSTTDATVTTVQTIPVPTDTGILIESYVKSRKTGGAGSGTTGDVNGYVRTVKAKNVGGTVTIGAVGATYTNEDITAFNCTLALSGTNIIVTVTGSLNNNVDWVSSSKII